MPFDPDAAAQPGSGIFGLPFTREEASIVLVPVPFDATTSYGGGTSAGPRAILEASAQVDLYDHQFGRTFDRGIHMLEIPEAIEELSRRARDHALPIIEAGGADPQSTDESILHALGEVNRACEAVAEYTHDEFTRILRDGKIPGLVGGDHSTPFGAIQAVGDFLTKHPRGASHGHWGNEKSFGILQVDAHMDLRVSFEGFKHSHASIMHNVLTSVPQVSRVVQIGIRDYGQGELEFARTHPDRVKVHFDQDIADGLARGETLSNLLDGVIAQLPPLVYVTFDVDALDPALCPNTGTPVPGGLSFPAVAMLLKKIKDSGKAIVGFDLVEVCPAPGVGEGAAGVPGPGSFGNAPRSAHAEWDASVGARLLYKLCGLVA